MGMVSRQSQGRCRHLAETAVPLDGHPCTRRHSLGKKPPVHSQRQQPRMPACGALKKRTPSQVPPTFPSLTQGLADRPAISGVQ